MNNINKLLRIEWQILLLSGFNPVEDKVKFTADTEEECVKWIHDHTPPDWAGNVTYIIQKVWTTNKKKT